MEMDTAFDSAGPFAQLLNPAMAFDIHERSQKLSDLPRRIYCKLDDAPPKAPTQEQLRVDAAIDAGRAPPVCR